ncbi:hypothetical protein JW868_02955 [Candidatus Woesearchaeota archaeon]|nr:hypothetical protein [Candidatus Woesearchaeota archaeon]
MNFFKIIKFYFFGGKEPKEKSDELEYHMGIEDEKKSSKKPKKKKKESIYDTDVDDTFNIDEGSGIYLKKDDFFSHDDTANKVKVFNYKWFEWLVILVEITLIVYAILIFLGIAPLF